MQKKFQQFVDIIKSDPAVATVGGFAGGQATNTGNVFVTLKPLRERGLSTPEVIDRMRPKLLNVAGARLFLQSGGGIRAGGRQGNGDYQYTIQADALEDLNTWVPKITAALAGRAGAAGRQFRPAGQGPAGRSQDRPRHRRAAGPERRPDRQCAV